MRNHSRTRPLEVALAVATALSLGCVGTNRVETNSRRTPEVNTGAGATILWPGQTPAMPGMPGGAPGAGTSVGPGAAGGASLGSPGAAGSAAPGPAAGASGGGGFTYLGGASLDDQQHDKRESQAVGSAQIPLLNILTAPFAAIAVTIARPFLKRKLEASDPGSAPPHTEAGGNAQAPVADPGAAHEQAAIDALERELAARRAAEAPTHPEASADRAQRPSRSGAASRPERSSIAEELAALRRAGTPSPGAVRSPGGSTAGSSQPLSSDSV